MSSIRKKNGHHLTLAVLIIFSIMLVIFVVAFTIKPEAPSEESEKEINYNSLNKSDSNYLIDEDCPKEMNKEVIYLTHYNFIPSTQEIPIITSSISDITFDNKGKYSGYCRKAKDAGENINYFYCGFENRYDGQYSTYQITDSNGILQPISKWRIKFILDKNCSFIGGWDFDEYGRGNTNVSSWPTYECKIIKAECKK